MVLDLLRSLGLSSRLTTISNCDRDGPPDFQGLGEIGNLRKRPGQKFGVRSPFIAAFAKIGKSRFKVTRRKSSAPSACQLFEGVKFDVDKFHFDKLQKSCFQI